MMNISDIFIRGLPSIDLHGTTKDIAKIMLIDFINDNIYLKNKKIIVIHGIGLGIIKEVVHDELKTNQNIDSFYINSFNNGITIINLKIEK